MNTNEQKNENIVENNDNLFSSLYITDILKGAFKFWYILLIFVVLFSIVKVSYSFNRYVPAYSVSATFTINTQRPSQANGGISSYTFYYDTTTASQLADTFPYILGSNLLYDAIREDLHIESVPVVLNATNVAGSNMFTISATGADPDLTYQILNSAIKTYPDVARYVIGNIKFTMITEPVMSDVPVNYPNVKKDLLYSCAAAGILWCALVVFYALQRKTIRTKEDIKTNIGKPVLGTLPNVTFKKYKKEIDRSILLTNDRVGNGFLESLRLMRNTFIHSIKDTDKVVMVTSTAPSEGKTTVLVNLALSLSDLGKKVLLIDADLRNPSVLDCLNVDENNLSYIKRQNYRIAKMYDSSTLEGYNNISFMRLKYNNDKPWRIIKESQFKSIINENRDKYDYILIDTPPCGLVSDTMVIAQSTDVSLYVILQDTIRVSRIKNGLDNLLSTDANVIGCVLNGAQSGISGYGSNYGYGYGYNYGYRYRNYGRRYGYGYGYGYGHKEKNEE